MNEKLDEIETELTGVLQVQIDDMIDDVIKTQLDKNTGGLGTTLLTNYGIEHVYPWRPWDCGYGTPCSRKPRPSLHRSSYVRVVAIPLRTSARHTDFYRYSNRGNGCNNNNPRDAGYLLKKLLAKIKKICQNTPHSASVAQLARAQPCQG